MTHVHIDPRSARRSLAGVIGDEGVDDGEIVEIYATAAWSCLAEPGDGTAGRLVQSVGAVAALAVAARGDLAAPAASGIESGEFLRALERWRPRLSHPAVEAALATARLAGIRLLAPHDPQWPAHVCDLGVHAPSSLWVRGDPAALAHSGPAVALVGARAATSYGEHVAGEIAAALGGAGVPIISGGAYGIDGAAHRAALAAGGTTLALSAGGADRPYPSGHAQLMERIARGGAVISEVPCGAAPTKWRFLQRNRLIAALSDATVVVEAGWRSGSLNTAGHAAALARGLGAVPGPVTSPASSGCHRLLREYDAVCITGADDVRELIGLSGGAARVVEGITDDLTRVRDALSRRAWRSVDDVAARAGMAVGEVQAILGRMHAEGRVVAGPAGWRTTAR